MPRDLPSESLSWLLQRQPALSSKQWALLFLSLALPTVLVSLPFLWRGYWQVLACALLELGAIGLCLHHCARHAADYDRIEIGAGAILIEQCRAGLRRRCRLDPWTTRLTVPRRETDPIRLQDRDCCLSLGQKTGAALRLQVARELRRCLPYHQFTAHQTRRDRP